MKKEAYGWGGDAYPGEEPDAVANNDASKPRQDYTEQVVPDHPVYYQWVYINGHIVMDAERTPEQLVDDHGHSNMDKPLAYGRVAVQHRWSANFQIIHSNIGLNPVMKALKGYAKTQGWNDLGFVDHNGQEFGMNRTAAERIVRIGVDEQGEDEFGVYSDSERGSFGTPLLARGNLDFCRQFIRGWNAPTPKKASEFDFSQAPPVRKTVTVHEPWDDDYEDYENYVHTPYDIHDEENPMEAAAARLRDEGLTEPSMSPGFAEGLWYSNPDGGHGSAHLDGFNEQEQREIWAELTSDTMQNKAPKAPPFGPPHDWLSHVASDVGTGWQTVPKDWGVTEKNPNSDQQDGEFYKNPAADKPRSGLYECPHCGEEMDNYMDFRDHLMGEKDAIATPNATPDVAPIDLDKVIPADWNNSTEPDWVMMMSKTANGAISVGAIPDYMLNGYTDERGRERPGYRSVKAGWHGEPIRHQIVGQPFETKDIYHKQHPGLESFVDVFHLPEQKQVNIGYMHTESQHQGKGNATRLMQHVYDSYPDCYIKHGQRMHDAADKIYNNFRREFPERTGRTAAPKAKLPGPIPFIFDIDQDRVYVGFPGEEARDVQAGDYNPLGIVEGLYKPTGEVEIQTQTNMPYTIRHMVQLWYYMHPELEVKSVVMIYEDGNKQKLAGTLPFAQSMAEPPEGYGEYYYSIPREKWPEKFYHVAPVEAREDILANGLDARGRTNNHGFDPNDGWDPETGAYYKEDHRGDLVGHEWRPEGIYMWGDELRAHEYAHQGKSDIWEVTPHLDVLGDPAKVRDNTWIDEDSYDEFPEERAYFTDYVLPENVRLHTPGHGGEIKTSMALRPEDRDSWIEKNGPHMVHWTKPENVAEIMKNGLVPWNQQPGREPNWGGYTQTRKDHVYMSTPAAGTPQMSDLYSYPIHIDLSKLDPTKLKADEDQVVNNGNFFREKLGPDNQPPSLYEYNQGAPSIGEWAEDLGMDNPDWTYQSLQGEEPREGEHPEGALAHEGTIPPEALSLPWGMPKKSMALRPEDYEKWIATRGPYLWHWTKHDNVQSILENGLHPAERPHEIDEDDDWEYDEDARPPNWGGFFETRPNHVYLAPPNRDDLWGASADDPHKAVYQTPIQIDMRMLDPKKFKADEDRALSMWPAEPREEDYDTQDEFWDAQNAYDEERPPDPHQWSGDSQTLGDWASEHGLDDPEMTWDSLQGSQGAIAYEGHIPPEALSHVPDWRHGQKEYGWEMDKRNWEEPNPAWMPLFSKTAHQDLPSALRALGLPEDINIQGDSLREFLAGGRYDITPGPGPGAMGGAGIPDWTLHYKMRTPDHFVPFRKRFDDLYRPDDPNKTWMYDPELGEEFRDGENGIMDRIQPRGAERIDDLIPNANEDDPTSMYRGISHREWNDIHNTGHIMSNGSYNLGPDQVGTTSWAPNAGMAHSYAHGFAPWHMKATHEEPSYIVKVRRPHDVMQPGEPGVPDGELGMRRPVPASDITEAYRSRVYATRPGYLHLTPTDYSGKNYSMGSAHGVDSDIIWEPVPPEEWPQGGKMSKTAAAPDNVGEQVRDLLQTDPSAVEVYNALSPLGNVYVVGGAIRDLALGRVPKDIDIMAQGISPDDVIKALKLRPGHVEVTGNQFPVIRYFHPSGEQCEIALPRRERSTGGGGRKDFDVQMDIDMPVEEDLERRDFTGNSMAVDLKTGQLIDPYGGWRDLEAGKLKLVHPNAFKDDATRILRALSSKSRHGLHPDLDTQRAMSEWAHRIDTHVPAEQKSAELEKLMKGDDPAAALELAQQTGVLEHVIPELAATHGFDQKSKYHNQMLFDHIMSVLRKTAELNKDPDVRMAAALHDIGKPGSQWFDDEGYGHYYEKHYKPGEVDQHGVQKTKVGKDHEHHGADLARDRLKELTWGNKERQQRVEHLVRSHMFPSFEDEKGARKFLHKYDPDDVGHANDLLDIREADAGNKAEPWDGVLGMQRSLVQSAREQGAATNLSQLAINGGDVMRALGMKPGAEVGQALQYCQEIVLEDPSMNDKATLIEALKARGGQRMANVLDPVQDTLDADVFDNADKAKPKVKPHIVQWVRKQLETLLKANEYGDLIPHMKLVMTGSLTSYQWSHKSDLDVSVWLDYAAFPNLVRAEMIALMVNELDGTLVPGTTHTVQCYIVPSGLTFEDLYKPGLRSAYDLDKNRWIVAPERDRVYNPYAEVPALMGWVHDQAEKMKLLQNYDPPGAREFERQIHERRRRDQQAGKGDFSESNVLWKYLEHMELV